MKKETKLCDCGRSAMVAALESEVGDIDGSSDLGVIVDCASPEDTLGDLVEVVLDARAEDCAWCDGRGTLNANPDGTGEGEQCGHCDGTGIAGDA